jgi:hypothetical protein
MRARPSVAGHAQRLIPQCHDGSGCLADRMLARSDSCHFCGRAEITSRSRSGARSARNLDVNEHAPYALVSERARHESSIDVNDLMTRADLRSFDCRNKNSHLQARGSDATAGADAGPAFGPDFQS